MSVPADKGAVGVYLVLRLADDDPQYLDVSTGGRFKGRDPSVSIVQLSSNWVRDTVLLYVGKAGGSNLRATLRSRLKQYLDFGLGSSVGHWGGRLIWQLADAETLVICWKRTFEGQPRDEEFELIQRFKTVHGSRPFANLRD